MRLGDDGKAVGPKTNVLEAPIWASGTHVHSYRIAGLLVASDIALPGAIRADGQLPADVIIRSGSVPKALEAAAASGPTWQLAGDTLLLRMPDIASFLIRGGTDILYEADGALAADLPAFLSGPVMALLLDLRGQPVFRASAVLVNGQAVLFCGPSGAGKSTLAAALTQRGYPLLTDDVCAVSVARQPLAQPDSVQLKLWKQAVAGLGLEARRGPRLRPSLEKHYLDPGCTVAAATPIGAVYGLRETRPPYPTGIEAPNVVDAVIALRLGAYHPVIVRRLDRKDVYFHAAGAIANAAGFFHFTRPLNFATMTKAVAMLERHWVQIGLLEAAA